MMMQLHSVYWKELAERNVGAFRLAYYACALLFLFMPYGSSSLMACIESGWWESVMCISRIELSLKFSLLAALAGAAQSCSVMSQRRYILEFPETALNGLFSEAMMIVMRLAVAALVLSASLTQSLQGVWLAAAVVVLHEFRHSLVDALELQTKKSLVLSLGFFVLYLGSLYGCSSPAVCIGFAFLFGNSAAISGTRCDSHLAHYKLGCLLSWSVGYILLAVFSSTWVVVDSSSAALVSPFPLFLLAYDLAWELYFALTKNTLFLLWLLTDLAMTWAALQTRGFESGLILISCTVGFFFLFAYLKDNPHVLYSSWPVAALLAYYIQTWAVAVAVRHVGIMPPLIAGLVCLGNACYAVPHITRFASAKQCWYVLPILVIIFAQPIVFSAFLVFQ